MNIVRGNMTSGEIWVFQLLAWLADFNIMLKLVFQANQKSLLSMNLEKSLTRLGCRKAAGSPKLTTARAVASCGVFWGH